MTKREETKLKLKTKKTKDHNFQFPPADKQIQYPQRAKKKKKRLKKNQSPLTGICDLKLLSTGVTLYHHQSMGFGGKTRSMALKFMGHIQVGIRIQTRYGGRIFYFFLALEPMLLGE